MIVVEELQQVYAKSVALEIDHLVIEPGTTALVGHNGAGKSTLLLIAAGLIRPTRGTVQIDGHAAGSLTARSLVSFVPDQPALFDDLSLWDQMTYVARLHGQSEPTEMSTHLTEILEASELLERYPNAMSKGQRQKASLLVATARPLTVLLADEPTTGLDSAAKSAFVEALSMLVDIGVSIVSSTHDDELIDQASTELRLEGGRVVGAPARVETKVKPGDRSDRWARPSQQDEPE